MSTKWAKVRLSEVLDPISREELVDSTKEYRLLGVRLDGQGPFLREVVTGVQTSATKLFRVAKGDFIYSRLFAWRGAFGVIDKELDECYVSGEFLYHYLSYVRTHLETIAPQSAQKNINLQILSPLPVPRVNLAEQHRIVACLDEHQAKVSGLKQRQEETAAELDALLPSILDKAFKGDL